MTRSVGRPTLQRAFPLNAHDFRKYSTFVEIGRRATVSALIYWGIAQGWATKWSPGLVNVVVSVALHFCLHSPERFLQSVDHFTAHPCRCCSVGRGGWLSLRYSGRIVLPSAFAARVLASPSLMFEALQFPSRQQLHLLFCWQ